MEHVLHKASSSGVLDDRPSRLHSRSLALSLTLSNLFRAGFVSLIQDTSFNEPINQNHWRHPHKVHVKVAITLKHHKLVFWHAKSKHHWNPVEVYCTSCRTKHPLQILLLQVKIVKFNVFLLEFVRNILSCIKNLFEID